MGLDEELARELKEIAKLRGMSIASYMRKLIKSALELEKMGYFAPKALEDKKLETVLATFNFTYLPLELLNTNNSPKDARALGEMIGAVLKEMGVDIYSVVEYIGSSTKTIITHKDKLVIVSTPGGAAIGELIKGIAKGGGLDIYESGGLSVINMPQSTINRIKSVIDRELKS